MTMEAQQPIRPEHSLLDVAVDDRVVGNGGTRRPGNLWTAQAREDMFRRREAGETWETICLVFLPPHPSLRPRRRENSFFSFIFDIVDLAGHSEISSVVRLVLTDVSRTIQTDRVMPCSNSTQ